MQNMDFWFFWKVFKKRWNIILLVACIVAMGVGVYSKLFIKPTYCSSVSLYLGRVTENSVRMPSALWETAGSVRLPPS